MLLTLGSVAVGTTVGVIVFALGLSGAFVIEPKRPLRYVVEKTVVIQEWNLDTASDRTRPAMEMAGMQPNSSP